MYKFDILFHKQLQSGGEKVVTYSTILQNPNVFGETLLGAEGFLSLNKGDVDADFSIDTLLQRYQTQLIGPELSKTFFKNFPLKFTFSTDDALALQAKVVDNEGREYLFEGGLNAMKDDASVSRISLVIPVMGELIYNDKKVKTGELLFVPYLCKEMPLVTEQIDLIIFYVKDKIVLQ